MQQEYLDLGRNLILMGEAKDMARALKAQDIDFILLKGLYLAFNAYPHPGMRPMCDIDIFIKRQDMDLAVNTLCGLGYSEITNKNERKVGAVNLIKDEAILIDMHCCLYQNRFKDAIGFEKGIWDRALYFDLGGLLVKALCDEDCILHIAMHYTMNHLCRGQGPRDLFYFIRQRGVDWEKIVSCASRYHLKTSLYYCLKHASSLYGLIVPDRALNFIKPSRLRELFIDFLLIYKATYLLYLCQILMLDGLSNKISVAGELLKSALRRIIRLFSCPIHTQAA